MSEELMNQLINAANVMQADPNAVTNEQRHAAEKVFLDFQKMKSPYLLCKHIFDTCQNDYVLFQTVAVLKSALIREWSFLSAEEIESLRAYLLRYICEKIDLKHFVREQISMALAMMVKRGSIGTNSPERNNILNEVSNFIATGNQHLQHIGCSILNALLNEYASSSKSSNINVTWETHLRAKKNFEDKDMKRIFQFCLEGLIQLEKSELNPQLLVLFRQMLSVSSQILTWNFQKIPIQISRRIFDVCYRMTPSFRPPSSWKSMVMKPEIVQTFFKVHWKIRSYEELSDLSLQCLAQLSTLNGAEYSATDYKLAHLTVFVRSFLEFLTSCTLYHHETFGISNIFAKLVIFYPSSLLCLLPQDMQDAYFNKMTEITCDFACKAAQEESVSKDDQLFMESFTQMLEGWVSILGDTSCFNQPFCRENFIQLFNCYLKCHLSAPDGNRGQNANEIDEIDEIEEDDRTKFKDHLIVVGCFGRNVPDHSLPLLFKLIEDRVTRFHGQLQRILQHSSGMHLGDSSIMTTLCEDIHWLVMVAGHVLVMDCKGETPLIPSEINNFSLSLASKVDFNVTLQVLGNLRVQVLGSPSQRISDIPGVDSADQAIRLISVVFRLCEVEKKALEANLEGLLSPEVASTLIWFVKYWSSAYLMPIEKSYTEISPSFLAAFGKDSDAGVWIVDFIISKICSNILHWNSEPALIEETINCLNVVADSPARSEKVLKNQELINLINREEIGALQSKAKRGLYRALVLAGSYLSENDQAYLCQILKPLFDKFESLISRQDFMTVHAEETVRNFVMNFIEAFIGVAEGCHKKSGKQFITLILPVLKYMNKLFKVYHCYNVIVKLILKFYLRIINILNIEDHNLRHTIYLSYMEMLQLYSKNNKGVRTKEVNAEEEQYEDIETIILILSELLSKDFLINFLNDDVENADNLLSSAEVSMYGLQVIMPLMTTELLEFPNLCKIFYRLLTLISQVHPIKIFQLHNDLLTVILQSIEYGLKKFTSDVAFLCLEFVNDLGIEIHNSKLASHRDLLLPFLKMIMDLIFEENFPSDHCSIVSSTVFTLVCLYKETFAQLIEEMFKRQNDPTLQKRLIDSFNKFTDNITLVIDRMNRKRFRDSFEKFVSEVQGIVCIK